MSKKKVLGRGLDALMNSNGRSDDVNFLRREANEIDINLIEANPFQPRNTFDAETLDEMALSIKEIGVIQPITVRVINENKFQLISGERRLRASKIAGLKKIPAYIRTANDQGLLEMALVENIQREDLDAIDIGISYKRLMDECSLTQDKLSSRVGKKRSTISNYVRLLSLPAKIQAGIREDKISMGHARALLSLKDDDTKIMIYNQILKYDFSVRKLEQIIREINEVEAGKNNTKKTTNNTEDYKQLQKHLSGHFNTKVEFKRNDKGKGKITIPFNNDEELERIVAVLDKLNT